MFGASSRLKAETAALTLFATTAGAPVAGGDGACDFSRHYAAEVGAASSALSLGSIISDRANASVDVSAVQNLGGFGYLLAGVWSYSDIDNPYAHYRRAAFTENDPYLFWGCELPLCEGVGLDQRFGLIFITQDGYRCEWSGENDVTYREWTYDGSLKNPWAEPYVQVRVGQRLGTYCKAGVCRRFALGRGFAVRPRVEFYGGSERWNLNRYGTLDSGGGPGCGFCAVSYGARLTCALGCGWSVYCDLLGYDALTGGVRRRIDARRRDGAATSADEFVFGLGFVFEY